MRNIEVKNQAVDLTALAVGIIVLGIVVSIGSTILIGVRDSRLTDLSTVTTVNERITSNNATAQSLTKSWVKSVINVTNSSNGAIVNSPNYTLSVNEGNGQGTVVFNNQGYMNGSTVNVSYNWYNTSRSDWAVANNASGGLTEYGNWFDILVIVGVAAVVLSLIFMAFGRGKGEGGVSY